MRLPVRPSPACGLPGGTGALGPFPGLRTLQLPAAHAGAGTVLAHWTGSYVTDICRSSFDVRAAVPLIVGTGVATAEEIGMDTFEQRMRDEQQQSQAVAANPMLLSAWATTGPQ